MVKVVYGDDGLGSGGGNDNGGEVKVVAGSEGGVWWCWVR